MASSEASGIEYSRQFEGEFNRWMHKLRCFVWPSEHLNAPFCHTQTYLALKSAVYGVLEIKVLNEARGDERVDKRILVGVH